MRALPYVVWVGDSILGYGQESFDLSSISVVTFDSSKLTAGKTIAISYGEEGPMQVLTEKLSFDNTAQ